GEGERQGLWKGAGLAGVMAEELTRQHPDALWMVADAARILAGRCALWWTKTPPYERHRLGLIGHYAARDVAAAAPLLQLACEQLAARACTLAVRPMAGNT